MSSEEHIDQSPAPELPPRAEAPPADPVHEALARASRLAHRGDFGAARRSLAGLRSGLAPADQARLDAFERSFRVDRAVKLVVGATLVALLVIALLSLFH